jgi:hypothetical protein
MSIRFPNALRLWTAASLLVTGGGAMAEWQPPAAVPGYTGGFQLGYPEIRVAEDFSVAVAWEENGGEPWVARREGLHGGWLALQVGPAFGYRPRIAMNAAGDLAVVWIGSDRTSVRYRPAGGPWESAALLELGNPDIAARVAINAAGDVLVAWIGIDEKATQYEVHAAFRAKAGPWPATGEFETPGGAANLLGDLDVGLDDDGLGVAVWTTTYATIDDLHSPSVLRGALRGVGGGWSAPTDLSPRGEEGEMLCAEDLPVPFPDARQPRLAVDPASGDLALAYVFDPTGVEVLTIDGELACGPVAADRGVTLGAGSTTSLPVGGAQLGTWVDDPPEVSLVDGTVALAWRRCEDNGVLSCELSLQAGVAALGTPPALSVDTVLSTTGGSALRSFGVAATAGGGGFLVHDEVGSGKGWEMAAGVAAAPPASLRDQLSGMNGDTVAVVATPSGYAVAALLATDRKVYLAEVWPWLFRDDFESGAFDFWNPGPP